MSYIPSKAMPHAAPADEPEDDSDGIFDTDGRGSGSRTAAIVGGAAVLVGAIAAAAIPLVKAALADAREGEGRGKGRGKKSSGKKSASKSKKK